MGIENKILRCKGFLEGVYGVEKASAVVCQAIALYQSGKDRMPSLKSKGNIMFMSLMDYMIFIYMALKEFEEIDKALKLSEECFNYSLDLDFESEEIRAVYKNADLLREKRKAIVQDVNEADEEYGWIYENLKISDDTLYSFDVKRCGMYQLCKKFGVVELMPHICQGDFYLMKYFPDGYTFHRVGTLVDGSDRCDFYYKKV